MHPSKKCPEYIFKRRIWRPPLDGEAAADCWRHSPPAEDAAEA